MNAPRILTVSLSFFSFVLTFAQAPSHTFYKTRNGKCLTERQADSVLISMQPRAKSIGMEVARSISNKTQRGDSVIFDVEFRIVHESMLASLKNRELMIGEPLPSFVLQDLQGNKIESDTYKGKPMAINMWFTTCPPCLAEMPELNKISKGEDYSDVVFLAITFESRKKVNAFLEKRPFYFQHLVDARAYCESFTTGYPINIFVNRDGIITDIMDGMPMRRASGETSFANATAMPDTYLHALNHIRE